MSARVSLYRKAEEELYKLDGMVKARFYDFCHTFRNNPDQPGLDLKKLKGDSRIYRAKVDRSHRALLVPVGVDADGTKHWLVIAVRHRKDVYEELQVAVNRVTGEIEFVDLAVVGDSALQRAGISLTPAEPDAERAAGRPGPVQQPHRRPVEPAQAAPLLGSYAAQDLRDLGVADQLIDLALAVTTDTELDELLRGAPLLSKDVLYGLAAGMSLDDVRREITAPVQLEKQPDLDDIPAALTRTKVSTLDEALRQAVEEGDFRAWKVFLHPTQERIAYQHYPGSARVTGGPGTGKTIVALHRVKHLAEAIQASRTDDGAAAAAGTRPILLTTFTANLAADLRARLASLVQPELLPLVDVLHVDQLAARVLGENTSARHRKKRVNDSAAIAEMRQLVAELGDCRWDPQFLFEEWDQVVLGHSVTTRMEYFHVRRAGRGRGLTRPERSEVWKLVEQFTARLDRLGIETWGQASERAARYEIARAAHVEEHRSDVAPVTDDSSGSRHRDYRYRHIVVDEAQDLRAAHWKLLRAMVDPAAANDLFIAGDTHQRIYDHQVTLGALGVNIRGRRSQRLTLSYRTTREILARALAISDDAEIAYDDLDDGTDTLAGYRSILHGPRPDFTGYATWDEELAALARTLTAWRAELSKDEDGRDVDPTGRMAVCVADRERVTETLNHLTAQGLSCAELNRDGSDGPGEIHIGTMHRFKGLEYERLAVIGVSDGVIPRAAVQRLRLQEPARFERELRKARALLFVAVTRARDTLNVTWHGRRSTLLPADPSGLRG